MEAALSTVTALVLYVAVCMSLRAWMAIVLNLEMDIGLVLARVVKIIKPQNATSTIDR